MRFKRAFLCLALGVMLLMLAACAAEKIEEIEATYCRVTFYSDGEPITWKRLAEGSVIRLVPERDQNDREILQWVDQTGNLVEPDGLTVTGDMDFYACVLPTLNTTSHISYMGDIASVWFRPDAGLRRGEAAQILYSLMERPTAEAEETADADAIEEADADGEEEAATDADEDDETADAPEMPLTNYRPTFSDVDASNKYYTAIQTVASYCLMNGYDDGTFRPDETVTRAEFASMLALYGATAEVGSAAFSDVPGDYWAAQVIEIAAANGWMLGYGDGSFYPERAMTRAEAVVVINRLLGYDADVRAISAVVPSDMYVDVSGDYWAYYEILSATYSSELLSYIRGEETDAEPGFIYLDDRLYHVNESLCLDYYDAGFHYIDGQLRYCSESGYEIDEFSSGRLELDGSMYWILSDGSFATDYQNGYLYFGEDGRYTSGSDYLDEMVNEFLSDILNDDSLSRERKLRAAYVKVMNSFGYINRNDAYAQGSTAWALKCAEIMFEKGSGHCYYWAGAFVYLARRLGYQAYPVCGLTGSYMNLHAWTMIDWPDGGVYVFDPELEWAYARGDLDGYAQSRDLYMQPFYSTGTLYTFADGSHTTQR